MSITKQDKQLNLAMRKVLTFAQEALPESILCIISFTQADDGSALGLNKVSSNVHDIPTLAESVCELMHDMLETPVLDLTDTVGGMQ